MKNTNINLGIDLGGTKIEIAALDFSTNNIIYRHRIPSPQNVYKDTLQAISDLIFETEQKLGLECQVGIGIPGSISSLSYKVRNANSIWLNDKPLLNDLSKILRKSIKIENDANCFTISEATDGAGANYNSVFGVILGTGVGSGIVINQQIVKGSNGLAGEWGHNPLPWKTKSEKGSRDCWCGKTDCIEKYISGPSIEKEYLNIFGKKKPLKIIVDNSLKGDENCSLLMDQFISRVARCFASVINFLDPDVIVIGGGLSNIERIYTDVPKIWSKWIFSGRAETKILKAMHGDSSGVRGAAWLNKN